MTVANKKRFFIVIITIIILALAVAAAGFTFAWYSSRTTADSSFNLRADGYLVVYFDEKINTEDTPIKPAVALKDAIRDNATDFDVLEVGGNITAAATVAEFESLLYYINADDEDTREVGLTFSCAAAVEFSDGTREALSLDYDLTVIPTLTVEYTDTGRTESFDLVWGERMVLDGNAKLTLTLKVYFTQPDDLCAPSILRAEKLVITVGAGAERI